MASTFTQVLVTPTILSAATIGPTEYSELQGSPREEYTPNGPRVTRQVITPYGNRHPLAQKFKGFSRFQNNAWYITPPQGWDEFPGAEVTNVSVTPFSERVLTKDGDTRLADYTMAQLEVQYEIPSTKEPERISRDGKDDVYVSEEIEVHGEFLTLGASGFFWGEYASGGPWDPANPDAHIWATPIKEIEAPKKLLKSFTWVYTRHKMAQVPSFMLDFVGCVNQNAVTSLTLHYDFPVETLLFDEPRLSRDITSQGAKEWKVTMKMISRPWGWQLFFRPGRQYPEPIWYIPPSVMNKHHNLTVDSPSVTEYIQRWKPYPVAPFELITG